jgi:GTPase Era involved in 16S rRNA processing
MNQQTHPKFAVVGHPNKGKSTIVSSLAMDDTVAISDIPGTTTHRRSFPLRVDDVILYELFDTPGFQRARAVLQWLKAHDEGIQRRKEVVESFIALHRDNQKFHDEVELLEAIMQGAGIIYVVDASKPYSPSYEVEMEILRWTGEPSMALINHIGSEDYATEWKRALGHYFKMVRTYNPMVARHQQHLSILESMAQLKEEWIAPVKASIEAFERYYQERIKQSAKVIASTLEESLRHIEEKQLPLDASKEKAESVLKENYEAHLRRLEREAQKKIETIWHHHHLLSEESPLPLEGLDLFSSESASLFGLTRKALLMTGISSGAITGAGVDLLFAGHTMLLGGFIGAIVGGVGAYMGFDELSEVKLLGERMGRRTFVVGPMKNRNFPYMLLGRLLWYTQEMITHSHADKSVISLEENEAFVQEWLEEGGAKAFERYHQKLRKEKHLEPKLQAQYTQEITKALQRLLEV